MCTLEEPHAFTAAYGGRRLLKKISDCILAAMNHDGSKTTHKKERRTLHSELV